MPGTFTTSTVSGFIEEAACALDLSAVPAGGPYRIVIPGIGASAEFRVASGIYDEVSRTVTRSLYHQRCGIALEAPYTTFTRGACHTTVQTTDAVPPAFITQTGPTRPIRGGWHDAGDFDRSSPHLLISAWMMTLYEAYPSFFVDGALNIPESGNGIPDWLDEALWGLLLWEQLQDPDGGVRASVEANQHPSYSIVNAATDRLVYRTYGVVAHVTVVAAAEFAQASRLVRPFDASRADILLTEARRAWAWYRSRTAADPSVRPGHRMYAASQLYLATGESAFLDELRVAVRDAQASNAPYNLLAADFDNNGLSSTRLFAPYFFSLLLSDDAALADLVAPFRKLVRRQAEFVLANLAPCAFPLGPADGWAWGSCTAQGCYAEPLVLMHRLTGKRRWYDGACRLGDYLLGLNPPGRSYITGLGIEPLSDLLQLDSYFFRRSGLGTVPGIVAFGPTADLSYDEFQSRYTSMVYPRWTSLPIQRRYSDGWAIIACNEFTVWRSIGQNACLYAFLAGAEP